MAIAKFKTFLDNSLKSVTTPLDRTANLEPEIGLTIIHSPNEKTLHVTVLGARHLPQNFGFTRVNSYVVKIKLFPGKDKFETTSKNESWPQWNEEFTFELCKEQQSKLRFGNNKSKLVEEQISASKFIIATLYAILEDKPLIATEKKNPAENKDNAAAIADVGKGEKKNKKQETRSVGAAFGFRSQQSQQSQQSQKPKSSNKLLIGQLFGKEKNTHCEQTAEILNAERKSMDKRRVIGATTIALDPKIFLTKPPRAKHSNQVSTGDLWKPLRPIASGISGAEERRENKKGQVEMILSQEKREKKDVSEGGGRLILSLSRLRCSLQTMHEQETFKGQLYIKMSVLEGGRVTHFWKSDRFAPSVSLKFSPDEARVIAENPYEGALNDVTFVIKFISKNKMGKKTTIGHFVIGPESGGTYADQWKQAMANAGQPISKWQPFQ